PRSGRRLHGPDGAREWRELPLPGSDGPTRDERRRQHACEAPPRAAVQGADHVLSRERVEQQWIVVSHSWMHLLRLSSPRRTQLLTVPSGAASVPATSSCVRPFMYARHTALRCCAPNSCRQSRRRRASASRSTTSARSVSTVSVFSGTYSAGSAKSTSRLRLRLMSIAR